MKTIAELQKELEGLPLIAPNGRLRKKRDRISAELLELARVQGKVSEINLMAGTIN